MLSSHEAQPPRQAPAETQIFDTLDSRVTVFDRVSAAFKGLRAGLGLDGEGFGLDALRDAIFGKQGQDAVAAGEELGRITFRFRQAGENMGAAIAALRAADLGGAAGAVRAGMGELGGAFSLGTVASVVLGAAALNGLGRALLGFSVLRVLRIGALAYGLTQLAMSGGEMGLVDWAALGLGLTAFSGGIAKTATALTGMGTALGALSRFMPLLSLPFLSGDTPQEQRNRNWEDDPRADDWRRQWLMLGKGPGARTKDDDAFAGMGEFERDAFRASRYRPDIQDPVTRRAALAATEPTSGTLASLRASVDSLVTSLGATRTGWTPADQGDRAGQREVTIRQMPAITLSGVPTVNAPPSGVQQVTVTNPVRPNVSVSVVVNNVQSQSPEGVGAAVGARVRAEVEAAYTDGGM